MLSREDVERIVENVLRDVSISVTPGDFTDPNSRKICLEYKDRIISTAYIDIKQTREYED